MHAHNQTRAQEIEPFEDSSNWRLDPAYTGSSRDQRGGDLQARAGGEGAGAADAAWQQPEYTLAIGEMEDDRVGEETAAKAAAFFDVSLDSPQVSSKRATAASSLAAGGRSSGSSSGGRGTAADSDGGGVPAASSARDPGSSGGGYAAKSREPTAAEMWMYGSGEGGSGAALVQ